MLKTVLHVVAQSAVMIVGAIYVFLCVDFLWGHPFTEWLEDHLPVRKPRHKPKHAKKLFRRRH